MARVRLPSIAAHLLKLVCRDEAGRDAVADLKEEFHEIAGRHGFRAARRWYRRQVARSVGDRLGRTAARAGPALAAAPRAFWRLIRVGADLVPAARALRRAPWYSATVVAVVALALSLATTVFAVVDGVLFKPLPYPDDERLVQLTPMTRSMIGSSFMSAGITSMPDLRAWRDAVPEMSFTATTFGGSWPISDNESPRTASVDRGFFDVTGVRPLLGGFTDEDFGPLTDIRPALVTYGFWQQRLAGDPLAIGRVLAASDGRGLRVVGVLKPDFLFPHGAVSRFTPEAILPLDARPEWAGDPRRRYLHVVARVPDGLALEVAAERLTAAAARVAETFPPMSDEDRAGFRGPFVQVQLDPLRAMMTRSSRSVSSASMAAAGALVLLACLNLAGLAGGRVLDRRRELSMRRALGAGAAELVRVVLAEHLLLLAAGGAVGVALSWGLLRAAPWLLPEELTVLKAPVIDARVAAFAVFACAAALAVVTWWSSRGALRADLRPGVAGAGGATERARTRARVALVAGQVALALVMVVAGTLFAASLARVWGEDPGFQADRAAVLHVRTPDGADLAYIDDALTAIRRVPGVSAAGGLGGPFLQRAIMGSSFEPPAGALETGDVEHLRITAGTLEALGLRAVDGRLPSDDEHATGRPVLVVSETVARAYFPRGSAVGRTVDDEDGRAFEVIGVVPDVRYRSLDSAPDGELYSPVGAWPEPDILNVVVSYAGDAADGLAGTLSALTSHVPTLRVRNAMTMRQQLGTTVQSRQFQTATFVGFGLAALAVASAGILGLIAMTVARRTREVGIRMALGATPAGVVGLIVREHLPAVAAGLTLGTLGAAWAVRAIASYLYEMTAYDWRAWSVAVGVLLVVTTTAALVPSLRASRVDPVTALRTE